MQRTHRTSPAAQIVHRLGLGERVLRIKERPRTDLTIRLFDPCEAGFRQFDRRKRTRTDLRGGLSGG